MIESFASKAPLKGGPGNMEPDNKKSGEIQSFAAKAPLKEAPASNMPWGGHGNAIETFGVKAPLKQTPQKGYTSGTPMSDRAIKQSK